MTVGALRLSKKSKCRGPTACRDREQNVEEGQDREEIVGITNAIHLPELG